jgi:hypothetical protein
MRIQQRRASRKESYASFFSLSSFYPREKLPDFRRAEKGENAQNDGDLILTKQILIQRSFMLRITFRRAAFFAKRESSGRFEFRAGQESARGRDVFRIDAELRGEVEQVGFVRENEIEHGGEEGGIDGGAPKGLRSKPALRKKAPQPGAVAGDEAERLGGDRFGGILAGIDAFAGIHGVSCSVTIGQYRTMVRHSWIAEMLKVVMVFPRNPDRNY